MLRIHRTPGLMVVFMVSGQLHADNVTELCHVVDAEPAGRVFVLDLTDLILADRDAVRLLGQYDDRGRVVLRNCPAFIRTWMAGESDRGWNPPGRQPRISVAARPAIMWVDALSSDQTFARWWQSATRRPRSMDRFERT
jgi:hypothetical protein